MQPTAISPTQAADRVAIRELVDMYAYSADRRDIEAQMALFTSDAHFVVFMEGQNSAPTQELLTREALRPVFADLNKYQATFHFMGQYTIFSLDDGEAKGGGYCLAHHLSVYGTTRKLMIATLRYHDTFAKRDGAWLFAERLLYVDWIEERTVS